MKYNVIYDYSIFCKDTSKQKLVKWFDSFEQQNIISEFLEVMVQLLEISIIKFSIIQSTINKDDVTLVCYVEPKFDDNQIKTLLWDDVIIKWNVLYFK